MKLVFESQNFLNKIPELLQDMHHAQGELLINAVKRCMKS